MKRAALLLGSATATAVAAVLGAFAFAPLSGCLNDASPAAEAGAAGNGGNNNNTTTTDASLGDDDDDAGDATVMVGPGDDDDTADTGTGDDDNTADTGTGTGTDGQASTDGGTAAIAILRIGDSTTTLATDTTIASFVDLYTSSGTLVRSIALPSAAVDGGSAHLLTFGGSTTEGYMTLSTDKTALYVAGHDIAPGANLASDAGGVAFGRIDSTGALTIQAPVTGIVSPEHVRSIATVDGGPAWVSDNSGVYYVSSARAATKIATLGSIPRELAIFGGQLFGSSDSTGAIGVSSIGTGLPTTTATTAILDGSVTSPTFQYVMFDTNADGTQDLLYLACSGGVEKWTYSLTTTAWSKTTSTGLTVGGSSVGGEGITGRVDTSGNVTLYVTSDSTSDNRAFKVTDTAAGTTAGTVTAFATPPTNTAFRGVAFVPGT